MDRTTISSHAASAVLHVLFLMLAFIAPVTLVLQDSPLDRFAVQASEARIVELDPLTPLRVTAPQDFSKTEGSGNLPSNGHGDETGPRPRALVKSEPPAEDPSLKAAPEAVISEVAGLLAGFTDVTEGPDLDTMLGDIDDGGGSRPRLGFGGYGMAGTGVSCFHTYTKREKGIEVTHRGCDGVDMHGIGTGGMFGRGGRGLPEPDLGDKGDVAVRPTVVAGRPLGCSTSAACPWKEIIGKVIKRHRRELEFCYDRSLDRQRQAFSAELDVSFGIDPDGGTAEIEVASDSGVDAFDSCVEKRLARWVFPKTGTPIRANYPFRFSTI